MLHTEPPYNNYGTKILVARTGKIETRHLFSVERQCESVHDSHFGDRLCPSGAMFQIVGL